MSSLKLFIKKCLRPKLLKYFSPTTPISKFFGFDRGTPIDRFYLNQFLEKKSQFIVNNVVEIEENQLSLKHGGDKIHSHILTYGPPKSANSFQGDLTNLTTLPQNTFDTFICTQTLNFIYDYEAALKGIHSMLKPGGSLLISVAGLSQISRYDMDRWGDYWRFSDLSLRKLLEKYFDSEKIEIKTFGNVYAASNFLYGIASEELSQKKLAVQDNDYQIIICAHAIK